MKSKPLLGSSYRIEDRDGQLVLAGPGGRVIHNVFTSRIDVRYDPDGMVKVDVEFYAGEPDKPERPERKAVNVNL